MNILIKEIKIIQCSRPHTGSTVLINILYGMICADNPVIFVTKHDVNMSPTIVINNLIIKTHFVNIDRWMEIYSEQFDLYFVCSEREGNKISKKFRAYDNVLTVDYERELLASHKNTLEVMIDKLYSRLSDFLPYTVVLNKETGLERVFKMNQLYEEMNHKPFSYYDKFYHLHGSHRHRETLNSN